MKNRPKKGAATTAQTPAPQASYQDLLHQSFLNDWNPFLGKIMSVFTLIGDIGEALKVLGQKYGHDVIALALIEAKFPAADLAKLGINVSAPAPVAAPVAPPIAASRVKTKKAKKKNLLSFTDLKPEILRAVKKMPVADGFTTKSLGAQLKHDGVRFDKGHINLILRRSITGLVIDSSQKPKAKNGKAMNLFRVVGPLDLVKDSGKAITLVATAPVAPPPGTPPAA